MNYYIQQLEKVITHYEEHDTFPEYTVGIDLVDFVQALDDGAMVRFGLNQVARLLELLYITKNYATDDEKLLDIVSTSINVLKPFAFQIAHRYPPKYITEIDKLIEMSDAISVSLIQHTELSKERISAFLELLANTEIATQNLIDLEALMVRLETFIHIIPLQMRIKVFYEEDASEFDTYKKHLAHYYELIKDFLDNVYQNN